MERIKRWLLSCCGNYTMVTPQKCTLIGETSIQTQVYAAMLRNHCIIIWRNIFVTAAIQKNEANMAKQNVYFMGLLYSEIMYFFFFVVQVPFLL